jgi:ribonucleotide reductase, class II
MVRELERQRQGVDFPEAAPAANPVFFRTYSRRTQVGTRETWGEVSKRTLIGLIELGKLTPQEVAVIERMQRQVKSLPSGRWLWVGGTDWMAKQLHFYQPGRLESFWVNDGFGNDGEWYWCGTRATIY